MDRLAGIFYYDNEFNRGDHGDRHFFLDDTLSSAPIPSLLLASQFGVPTPFATPGQKGIYDGQQDTEYLGVFGQATWNITDQFAITGGLRWQQEDKDASIDQGVNIEGRSLLSQVLLVEAISGDLDRSTSEVTWSVTPQYFINDDLSYDEYPSGLCYPGRSPDNPATGTCDLSGEHPINAPEWTTHLGLMYQTDVSWGEVYARVDWAWPDEYNTSFSADPRLVQDSYDWVNLRLGTRLDMFEVVAWVDNALDEDVRNSDSQLNLFGRDPSYQTYRQAPRSYGLTLRVDF